MRIYCNVHMHNTSELGKVLGGRVILIVYTIMTQNTAELRDEGQHIE